MPFYEDICSDFDFQHSLLGRHGNIAGMHLHPHFEAILVANKTEQKNHNKRSHPSHHIPAVIYHIRTVFDAPDSIYREQ